MALAQLTIQDLWETAGFRPNEEQEQAITEKAALQLLEGLQVLLGHVTNLTGRLFDLAQMYVGTVHSLCQRILSDRRFSPDRQRARPPYLLDELGQYFHLARRRNWEVLISIRVARGTGITTWHGIQDLHVLVGPGGVIV